MEKAGINVKILTGVSDLHWSNGSIVDSDNIPIKRVWKTWAWETALDQIRDDLEDVITSYSIHYTKLYENAHDRPGQPRNKPDRNRSP